MARLVRLEATGPIKIDPAQFPRDEQGNLKPIWICACGLSSNPPFCDKSHNACKHEQAGTLYEYDPATKSVRASRPE
jgi:CDGSH-type Zn-finger protein